MRQSPKRTKRQRITEALKGWQWIFGFAAWGLSAGVVVPWLLYQPWGYAIDLYGKADQLSGAGFGFLPYALTTLVIMGFAIYMVAHRQGHGVLGPGDKEDSALQFIAYPFFLFLGGLVLAVSGVLVIIVFSLVLWAPILAVEAIAGRDIGPNVLLSSVPVPVWGLAQGLVVGLTSFAMFRTGRKTKGREQLR